MSMEAVEINLANVVYACGRRTCKLERMRISDTPTLVSRTAATV